MWNECHDILIKASSYVLSLTHRNSRKIQITVGDEATVDVRGMCIFTSILPIIIQSNCMQLFGIRCTVSISAWASTLLVQL